MPWIAARLPVLVPLAALACQGATDSTAAPAGSTSATAEAPLVAPLGGKVATASFEMTARSVKDCKVDEATLARPGSARLGIDVWIRARAGREVPANPFYARLSDRSGHSYAPVFGGCTPELLASVLREGDEAGGFITFELPPSAQGLVLEYSPMLIGVERQTVRFELGR